MANQLEILLQYTVNLIGDQNGLELPRRSGFLKLHRGRNLLITAAHGIEGKNWHLELPAPVDPGFPDHPRRAYKFPIGPFKYFKRVSPTPQGVDDYADFALTEVDVYPLMQVLNCAVSKF